MAVRDQTATNLPRTTNSLSEFRGFIAARLRELEAKRTSGSRRGLIVKSSWQALDGRDHAEGETDLNPFCCAPRPAS